MKEVFALKTTEKNTNNTQEKEEGFLLFLNESSQNNFLSFLKNGGTEVKSDGAYSFYEKVGTKSVPDYIYQFVQTRKTFFVKAHVMSET